MDQLFSTTPSTEGWLVGLLPLGLFCAGYFVYGHLRQRRYRRPEGPGFGRRVQGLLVGRVGALSYYSAAGELGRADEVLLVEEAGRTVPVIANAEARGLRAGVFLTVDGAPATLIREESLYREGNSQAALRAGRILVGDWPELRGLRVPVAIGCLVWLLGLCWLFATSPHLPTGRLFDRAHVEDVVPTSGR